MSIDWAKEIRSIVDLGSVSYEQRVTRTAIKIGAIALFIIVAWKVIK